MKAFITEKIISYTVPTVSDTVRFGGASSQQAESGIEIRTINNVTSVTAVENVTNVFAVVGTDSSGNAVTTNVNCDIYNLILMS